MGPAVLDSRRSTGERPADDRQVILVVEDDTSLRRVIQFGLEEDGYMVLSAPDGVAGLDLVESAQIDAVISDIRMPRMDGLELLARVKATRRDMPVVLLTAHGTTDTTAEAVERGAFACLLKPFDRNRLRDTLARALAPDRRTHQGLDTL